jgi:hypothetical protein
MNISSVFNLAFARLGIGVPYKMSYEYTIEVGATAKELTLILWEVEE